MNERIKELTGKALDQAMPQTWFSISPDDLDRIMKTFAELMHDECIDAVPTNLDPATYFKVLQAIKQHFGVKNDRI